MLATVSSDVENLDISGTDQGFSFMGANFKDLLFSNLFCRILQKNWKKIGWEKGQKAKK